MACRVEEYEKLLKELSHRVNITDQMLIRKALEKASFGTLMQPQVTTVNQ